MRKVGLGSIHLSNIHLLLLGMLALLLAACSKHEAKPPEIPPAEVSVMTVKRQDTPISYEYVGQTESSRQVQIVARVNGFLDKRVYTEGSVVKAGEVMFLQDPKPFQASLDASLGALAEQKARLLTAQLNLDQVKPLRELNALSQKDLDDATGQQQAAAASVETAKADVETARLNLGYTTITTPVTGLSSYARVQEGSYINAGNSLLTYVAQVDPIWVNFTMSENEITRYRASVTAGKIRQPENRNFVVEVNLADGSLFPHQGSITFVDADFNSKTGTFLFRATLPNPKAFLRPGQFLRVRVLGNIKVNAVLVPQRAVLQGAQGHFVFVLGKDQKVEVRPVTVGDWHGEDWFIDEGLEEGDVVVTDGLLKLSPGASVRVVAAAPPQSGDASPDTTTPAPVADKQ